MSQTKILLVDDDPDILETTRVALERADYEVLTATNGLEALGAVRISRPDLILLDVMMPGENGYRVARAIREDEEAGVYEHRNKIILVTARDLSNEPDREELFNDFARPDRVVYKPFELADLLRQVAELLSE
jgi:CheY-like chemotaxis protein